MRIATKLDLAVRMNLAANVRVILGLATHELNGSKPGIEKNFHFSRFVL